MYSSSWTEFHLVSTIACERHQFFLVDDIDHHLFQIGMFVQICFWKDWFEDHFNSSSISDVRKSLHNHGRETFRPRVDFIGWHRANCHHRKGNRETSKTRMNQEIRDWRWWSSFRQFKMRLPSSIPWLCPSNWRPSNGNNEKHQFLENRQTTSIECLEFRCTLSTCFSA